MPVQRGASKRAQDEVSSTPSRCPFLASSDGAWVSQAASTDHRCRAVRPAAPLVMTKQRRLCLTAAHPTCATFVAAHEARAAVVGTTSDVTLAWGWVRTTPIIDANLGRGAMIAGFLADRRGWQVLPAVALVAALMALGISNIGSNSASGKSPAPATFLAVASPRPVISSPTLDSSPAVTSEPAPTASPAPTPSPTPSPSASASYKVKSGDTLYGIAGQFGVTVKDLKSRNGLTSNTLHVGQVLLIP